MIIKNSLVLFTNPRTSELSEVLDTIKNDTLGPGSISFEKILPTPGLRNDLIPTWRKKNWGTDSDAFDISFSGNTINFSTNDAPPIAVIETLSTMFPDVDFDYIWFSIEDDEIAGFKMYGPLDVTNMRIPACYEPIVLFDAAGMTHKEWEAKRTAAHGIGGSEVAAILGVSKFATNLDIYRRKLGAPKDPVDEITQFMFDLGHLMEDMVARAFVIRHPEWELVSDTKMYRHSLFPFMTANVDYLVKHKETGEIAILECKYVTPDSEHMWRDSAPEYYVWQTRHYMAVKNINKAFVAALWGNNPYAHGIDHQVIRDIDIEREMIVSEARFWRCVETKTPPVLKCHKVDALKKFLAANTPTHATPKEIALSDEYAAIAERYAILEERHANARAQETEAKALVEEAKAQLMLALGDAQVGVATRADGTQFRITSKPKTSNTVDVLRLQQDFPAVYDKVVTPNVTLDALKKASAAAYKACVVTAPNATQRTFKVVEVSPH